MPRIPARPQSLDQDDSPVVAVLDRTSTAVRQDPPPRPATPPPRPATTPPPVVADVLSRRVQELSAAEELFTRQVDGTELSPDEAEFLRGLWPDKIAHAHEFSRVARYRDLQRAAGPRFEREVAETAARHAAEQLADEGAAIRERLAILQTQLADLEQSAAKAAREHDLRTQAVEKLTDETLLGEPFRSRYQAARQRWEKDYGIPARVARQTAAGLLTKSQWTADNDAEAIATYSQSKPELSHLTVERFTQVDRSYIRQPGPVQGQPRDRRHVTVNRPAWQEHVEELRRQAEAATRDAERLEAEGQASKAELDEMLRSLIPA